MNRILRLFTLALVLAIAVSGLRLSPSVAKAQDSKA